MLNVVNLFRVPHDINNLIRKFVTNGFLVPMVRKDAIVLVFMSRILYISLNYLIIYLHTLDCKIALGIIIPAWYAGLCSVMGAILALAENWHVSQGILYVLSNILGLANPLTDVSPDSSTFGKVIDVVISSIALGYIAIFADYVTTLNPSSYVRRKIRRCLITLGVVDADQTTSFHPLRQTQTLITSGGVEEDEIEREGTETTHAKSLLVGSFPAA